MKTFPALLITLSAILAALSGCRRGDSTTAPTETTVQAVAATKKTIQDEIIASGAIEAVDKAELGFLVAGRVLSVDVEDGAEVKKDQVLARLDPADYEQGLAIAEAKLAEVSARHERLAKLHELGSLTDTDYDKIVAGLREATASVELARRQLAYTELHAPFDGRVVKHGIAAGLVVGPGSPVFTILSPAPVWANVSVAEADARRVQIGLTVEVFLATDVKQVHTGKVEAVLPQADPLSRSFTVKIKFENADHALRPGNVAIAHIQTGQTHEAVAVPPQAVQKFADGSLFVWLVEPVRHIAVRQVIEAGSLQAAEVEVTAGLKAGDQIILNVPHTLFEGTPLKVTTP